jgi:non-canonical poly(A) RNA polymerase PAPD5/7
MSQSHLSDHFKILKEYIEQKDYENLNLFLDTNEIPKKTLNSILFYTLQNYRSNYQMCDYIDILIMKGADRNSIFCSKLCNQGPRIDEKDNVSLLMYACTYADIRLVESIATDENINLRDKNGKNALFYALSDKGDNPDVIGALISHKINVNCIGKVNIGDKMYENHSPLSLAATKNMINSFRILIEKNADPNFKVTPSGDTILHLAVKKNNVEMVELLLNTKKIKFEEKNKENKTALELALEMNNNDPNNKIYKLIKEKIEEGNRQGDIVAQELLSEDQKNLIIKKQNEISNVNLININISGEEKNKINNDKLDQNRNDKIINSSNSNNNINKKIYNSKKVISKEKTFDQNIISKIYNLSASLQIPFLYQNNQNISNYNNNNKYNNFPNFISIENNSQNIPILKINLLPKEFNDYKNNYNEIKKLKKLEEENAFLKQQLDFVNQKNNKLIQSNTEKDTQIKEMENKYQLSINELNKKITILEKEHENDINTINELKNEINSKNNVDNKKNTDTNNKNIIEIQSTSLDTNSLGVGVGVGIGKTITIQYLNKKFINYNYNLNFIQDKNLYVINCLSKDLQEFELYVTEHIKKSANIFDELIKNVQSAVNECSEDYEVHLYGSHATNLCLPWSDLDIVLIAKNNKNNQISLESKHLLLSKLYENLRHQSWIKDINYISGANIPIIKLFSIEKYNNMSIDISIQDENHFGLRCVDLVKQYMNKYESLKPLVLALKNILKRANLNDPYKGGISSYGLILMIVYFLQQQAYAGIDISSNGNNLGQLFYDFIHYYAIEYEFNKSVIFVKNNANDLEDLKYQNIQHSSGLIIIDPLNPANNVAKSCFQYLAIRMAFIISLKSLLEDCECGCHYNDNSEEYNNLHVEHCFLKRIFNAVKRFNVN